MERGIPVILRCSSWLWYEIKSINSKLCTIFLFCFHLVVLSLSLSRWRISQLEEEILCPARFHSLLLCERKWRHTQRDDRPQCGERCEIQEAVHFSGAMAERCQRERHLRVSCWEKDLLPVWQWCCCSQVRL